MPEDPLVGEALSFEPCLTEEHSGPRLPASVVRLVSLPEPRELNGEPTTGAALGSVMTENSPLPAPSDSKTSPTSSTMS